MKGMVDALVGEKGGADKMYEEQENIQYDTKYFDIRKNKVVDMVSRHNTIFGDVAKQNTPDYRESTIQPFHNFYYLNLIRKQLEIWFGPKAKNLFSEGNSYYEQTSGIHFHGDTGRKIVIGVCLGRSDTLRYMWRLPNSS